MDLSAYIKNGIIGPGALHDAMTQNPDIRVLDASFAMPGAPQPPRAIFQEKRIGSAGFFDIDAVADPHTDLPHMLPSPADFEKAVSEMGIGNGDTVVVYDQTGIAMAAARAWWMFRVFGHDAVCVLNGGLPGWEAAGCPVNTAPPDAPPPSSFKAGFKPDLVRTLKDVQQAVTRKTHLILDARSPQRFSGTTDEPRPGLRAGHIPGSLNLPFTDLIDPASNGLKDASALKEAFRPFEGEKPLIASCGSGVTACVLALAAWATENRAVSVYDGSWTEWGRDSAPTQVEKSISPTIL